MKLPTRVRAHEFYPDGVYECSFDDTPLFWCISVGAQVPGLPQLTNVDLWYSNPNGPDIFAAASNAHTLNIREIAGPQFPTIAGFLHAAYQPYRFATPRQIPPNSFSQHSGYAFAGVRAFVAQDVSCGDQGPHLNRLAIQVAPRNNAPADFGIAFVVDGIPTSPVFFGPTIAATNFQARDQAHPQHPTNWDDAQAFVAP